MFIFTGCSNEHKIEELKTNENDTKKHALDNSKSNINNQKEIIEENNDIKDEEDKIINENEDYLKNKEILTKTKNFMESLKWYQNTFKYDLGTIESYIQKIKDKKDIEIFIRTYMDDNSMIYESKYYLYKNDGYYTYVNDGNDNWIKEDIEEKDMFKIDINYDYLIDNAGDFKLSEDEYTYILKTTLKYPDIFNILNLGIGTDSFNIDKLKDKDVEVTLVINNWNFGLREIDIEEIVLDDMIFEFNFLESLIKNKDTAKEFSKQKTNKIKLFMKFDSYQRDIIDIKDDIGRIENEFSDYISEFQFKDVYAGIEDLVLLDLSDKKEDFSIIGMLGENEKCLIKKEGNMIKTLCEVNLYKHNINYFDPEELHNKVIEVHEENLNINNRNIRYFKIKYDSNNSGFKLSGDFEKNHYVFIIEINNDYSLLFDFEENSRAENYIEVIANSLK